MFLFQCQLSINVLFVVCCLTRKGVPNMHPHNTYLYAIVQAIQAPKFGKELCTKHTCDTL